MFGPNTATPVLAANRLARWSLMLSQYNYTIEYRPTKQHGNADALSRLPAGPDLSFDGEEGDNDVDTVCTIRTISSQLQSYRRNQLKDSTNKDPIISEVKRYVREGWPQHIDRPEVQEFKKYSSSLSVVDDCLINGNRVVIPEAMRKQLLDILHLGHFGMQKMKQLARSAVYWPHIDSQIEDTCRCCTACAEHQNRPPQPANHPWMMPEKPWSRIHIVHAINFMGSNWLIVTDAYSKYRAFTRPVQHLPKQPLRFWKKTLLTLDILTPSYQTTLQPSALQSSRNGVITEASHTSLELHIIQPPTGQRRDSYNPSNNL